MAKAADVIDGRGAEAGATEATAEEEVVLAIEVTVTGLDGSPEGVTAGALMPGGRTADRHRVAAAAVAVVAPVAAPDGEVATEEVPDADVTVRRALGVPVTTRPATNLVAAKPRRERPRRRTPLMMPILLMPLASIG
jgi:hypothetical protein